VAIRQQQSSSRHGIVRSLKSCYLNVNSDTDKEYVLPLLMPSIKDIEEFPEMGVPILTTVLISS